MASAPALDLERQRQAKVYARMQRRLLVVDLALGAVYVLAWIVLGLAPALRAALQSVSANEPWLVFGFAAVFGAGYYVVDLPLAYLSGFALPRRFGQSTQSVKGWAADQAKGLLLLGVLGMLLVEIVYALLRAAPESWWLWVAAVLLLLTVGLANLGPVLIFPLFNKAVPLGDDHAELAERLMRLAERAHTRVRGVYQFDMSRRTRAANAALTGLGNTRRIILGDTLLSEFTPDEVETILAHELGHHVHRDIPLGIAVQTALTLCGLYLASLGLRWGAAALGYAGVSDVATLPLFMAVMGAFGLVTMPLGNAFSRWRERRADEYALRATGNGAAFASALTRLANQNLAEVAPEPWVEFLLYSHPPLAKRIAMAASSPASPPSG